MNYRWIRHPRTHQELATLPRRPQRSWKVHRRTRYHRLAGLTARDVARLIGAGS